MIRIHAHVTFQAAGAVSRSWGPTLRGGFGKALRRVACSLRRPSCSQCPLGGTCAYGYLFETPITPAGTIMRKYPHAPHPFLFEPPDNQTPHVSAGNADTLSLVLVGKASNYLPFFLLSLQELGKSGLGRDRVSFSVDALTAENGEILFQAAAGSHIRNARATKVALEPGASRHARFSLVFKTPARIQVDGEISRNPTLLDVVRNLHRRLFLLRHFHEDGSEDRLSPAFLDAAKDARVLESHLAWLNETRHSTRQNRDVPIGGAIGQMVCEGDLGVMGPLLRAGEYVHVGKNATFGLGHYALVEGDSL